MSIATAVNDNVQQPEKISGAELKAKYIKLKEENPTLRARDAANELGVSEGELLSARVGDDAVRLIDDAQEILSNLLPLGQVMALTRNESCVHERKGEYDNVSFQGGHMNMGLAVNADIDLRLFMNHWKFNFAATEQTKGGPRKSLQFFNKAGEAVHKIYLTSKSNEAEYDKLVEKFTADSQPDAIETESYPAKKAPLPDSEINLDGFREGWENLQDTHDFYPLIMKHKLDRLQALKLIGEDFAYKIDNDSSRKMLELARDKECEIMVFVGNKGCIQIHTGPVNKLLEYGTWFNVMDPLFNLHLNEENIGESWVTRKPTEDGIVTALEIYDKQDDLIVTFFGKRKPGIPELELWREVVSEIPKASS